MKKLAGVLLVIAIITLFAIPAISAEKVKVSNEKVFKKDVLQSKQPVLVDFWAPWCGPCRMMAPELEKVAERLDGKLLVYKVNIDENRNLAREYKINAIPSLVLFKNGKVAKSYVGYKKADELVKLVEKDMR